MIRPRNFSGDGTLSECGMYETQGETKCGSVVAAAMASTDPGSGTSGLCAIALTVNHASNNIHTSTGRNMRAPGGRLTRKFSTRPPWQALGIDHLTLAIDGERWAPARLQSCHNTRTGKSASEAAEKLAFRAAAPEGVID